MKFEILDVEHGFAAYAIAGDGSVLLFDCGHSPTCRPSDYLWAQGIRVIRRLFVTNYDEDHIADLPMLRQKFEIEILTRNSTVNSTQLRNLKEPPISSAMKTLIQMVDSYKGKVSTAKLEPPGIQVQTFYNDYPLFTDTNNLSLLTFLDIGNVSFALPGDVERPGWLELLKNPDVCELLKRVNIFVASHHGRENGYCKEVFDYCSPSLVVMSDGPVQYDTQKMANTYGEHAKGAWFNHQQRGKQWRKVVTTRKDGNIWWSRRLEPLRSCQIQIRYQSPTFI